MATVLVIAALLGINTASYAIGYITGTARAAADIDDAFDTGHAFGTYRAAGDGS